MNSNVTIIAGATASGKSARAIDLASQKQKSVIINADSQQLYKALPILTAQPSIDDLNSSPHLLYGILDHHEQWSAATWANHCADLIRSLWNQNKHPIIVGGTGFYIKALLDGFSPLPNVPPEYRANGNNNFNTDPEKFYADLIKDDPLIEGKLNPNDKQRLIRAREVFDYTKQSIIEWQAKPNIPILPEAIFDIEIISLPRDILYARCEQRIHMMLDQGVMDEVMKLYAELEILKTPTAPVTKALGYAEFSAYGLGIISREESIEKTALLTRHYAKRQVTWFKNQIKPQKNIAVVQQIV